MENTRFLEQWQSLSDKDKLPLFENLFIRPLSKLVQQTPYKQVLETAHHNFIGGLVATAHYLISSSEDCKVKVWDRQTLTFVQEIGNFYLPINHLAISKDERFLAMAGDDKNIYIYRIQDWSLLQTLSGHEDYVSKVEFAGGYLVSISKDSTVKIWDYQANSLVHSLDKHGDWVYALAISPDCSKAITSSLNSSLYVWDIATGECLATLVESSYLSYVMGMTIGGDNYGEKGNKRFLNSILWLPNGKVITCAEDIVVWNDSNWDVVWHKSASSHKAKQIVYFPAHNLLVTASAQLQGWDLDTGELKFVASGVGNKEFYSCAQSGESIYTGNKDGALMAWDLGKLLEYGIRMEHTSGIYDVQINPISHKILSSSYYKSVIAWSKEGMPLQKYGDFAENNTKVLGHNPYQPHQQILVCMGEIQFLDTQTLEIVRKIKMDDKLVQIEDLCWINENTILTFTISYKPRLIHLDTGIFEILDTPYSFNHKHQLNEQQVLFATYPSNLLDKKNDQINWLPVEGIIPNGGVNAISPLVLFNLQTLRVEREFWYYPEEPIDGKISPHTVVRIDANTIAASFVKSRIVIWDINQGEITHHIQLTAEEYISQLFWYKQHLYIKGKSARLYLYDLNKKTITGEIALPGQRLFRSLLVAEAGVLIGADGGNLLIYDLDNLQTLFYENLGFEITHISLSGNLVLASESGKMFVFEWKIAVRN